MYIAINIHTNMYMNIYTYLCLSLYIYIHKMYDRNLGPPRACRPSGRRVATMARARGDAQHTRHNTF